MTRRRGGSTVVNNVDAHLIVQAQRCGFLDFKTEIVEYVAEVSYNLCTHHCSVEFGLDRTGSDGNGRFMYDSISKQDLHRCDCSRICGAGYLDVSLTRCSCSMSTRYSLDTFDVNQMHLSKRSPSTPM